MNTFLIAFAIFGLAVLGMAIGVIVGGRKLRGTCGGLADRRDSDGHVACDICTKPSETCRGPEERV